VDDPVVAGDAIKRAMAEDGHPPLIAAWLGPTKLAKAIMYATVTNIIAYLPFLLLTGNTGDFLYSLPIVMASALVCSRLVSMTFIPLLGYYLLRPRRKPEPTIEERRGRGFTGFYYRVAGQAIEHRWTVFAASLLFLALSVYLNKQLKRAFFANDVQYWSYLDIWLPNDAPFALTDEAALRSEEVIRRVAEQYGREHPGTDGKPRQILKSITTFVGGGGPRFWFSVSPQQQQLNYAQAIIEVNDKEDTPPLVDRLQVALSASVPGAYIDVQQLQTNPVDVPIQIFLSGQADVTSTGEERDIRNLRSLARRVARLRMEERAQLSDVQNLYVYASQSSQKVPLVEISSVTNTLESQRILRQEQFRTISVKAFPAPGVLASEALGPAMPALLTFQKSLPPGYKILIGGELAKQTDGFKNLAVVLAISAFGIYLALLLQFNNAIKPFLVFAATPYGAVGALLALFAMGTAFGFMAFLGIASLIGVIISHVIVLFDFIEEMHEKGEPLEQALRDAGIERLRPVMITVGATILALFPLAVHGGPLWQPLCYAQIGGLAVATFVTLLLVPVLYSIFVLDLKIVKWEGVRKSS